MHVQGIHSTHTTASARRAAASGIPGSGSNGPGGAGAGRTGAGGGARTGAGTGSRADGTDQAPGGRSAPLRVDAQRNLEHVLRAAREVFGELGYGAPMEDVARRARVGVGTVYRRFPSKDVLVRRIAEEETARLTDQARAALGQEDQPWPALSRFLRTSVASGAGRLLPPQILRADVWNDGRADGRSEGSDSPDGSGSSGGPTRVPHQRQAQYEGDGQDGSAAHTGPTGRSGHQQQHGLRLVEQRSAPDVERVGPHPRTAPGAGEASAQGAGQPAGGAGQPGDPGEDAGAAELLGVVGRLVQRAWDAGELRADVTVGDVLLVIATAAPSLPDADQQAAASQRLLDILLEGLRPGASH